LIHRNTDIIPDLTLLLLEVRTTSVTFVTASTALLLEVPRAVATSIVPDPAARVESSVKHGGGQYPPPVGGPHGINGPPDANPHGGGHMGGYPPPGDLPYGIIVDV
jgi:hypothetical protein